MRVWGVSAGVIVGQSDELVPAEKRVAYYRAMAAEALRLAQAAGDEAQKASYLDIAARWNTLANEVERRSAWQDNAARRGEPEGSSQPNGDRN